MKTQNEVASQSCEGEYQLPPILLIQKLQDATPGDINLSELLESDDFERKHTGLPIALGKDIIGRFVIDDLLKLPHLLIAGSRSSGKSTFINCILASLLFNFSPKEVQFLLIDSKGAALSIYEGIPHLINIKNDLAKRIITDPETAVNALRQMTDLMDRRYQDLKRKETHNIAEYNDKADIPKLPYIIIIIDELADLMTVSPKEVEKSISRFSKIGKEVGIHLIVSTRQPWVDIITGLIQISIPSRVAFAVTSEVDSRTILDQGGAEKLPGIGEMLYKPNNTQYPLAIHGAIISNKDIENIVAFWKKQPLPKNLTEIDLSCEDKSPSDIVDLLDNIQSILKEASCLIEKTREGLKK